LVLWIFAIEITNKEINPNALLPLISRQDGYEKELQETNPYSKLLQETKNRLNLFPLEFIRRLSFPFDFIKEIINLQKETSLTSNTNIL